MTLSTWILTLDRHLDLWTSIADNCFLHRVNDGILNVTPYAGADPGFRVRGAHLKKLRWAEGGANIFGVFRVKNHDFTPKKQITESPSYP